MKIFGRKMAFKSGLPDVAKSKNTTDENMVNRVIALTNQGLSLREIAQQLKTNHMAIKRIINKLKDLKQA
jgi:DNA invertase Pin-like site-specific DNA recombinase